MWIGSIEVPVGLLVPSPKKLLIPLKTPFAALNVIAAPPPTAKTPKNLPTFEPDLK